jgi:uncharacterized SAM-binding protein YcdF (DUF218 family)
MEWGLFKPILTNSVLPPSGPVLVAIVCLAWAHRSRSIRAKKWAQRGAMSMLLALWLLGCNQISVWLAEFALPQYAATSPSQLIEQKVQAIVVLGGGVDQLAPEYNAPDLTASAYMRIRYGALLARQLQLPLVFTGGQGWSSHGLNQASEADVALRIAKQEWQLTQVLAEGRSRDTHENANMTRSLLPAQTKTIALITHSWHMPRAVWEFEKAGFEVVPAPMGYILQSGTFTNRWIPTASSLRDSSWVIRERLGLWLKRS